MTRRGAAALPELDARAVVASMARKLADSGQIGPVGTPAVLATLAAHYVLERVDYPRAAYQFEHQATTRILRRTRCARATTRAAGR